MYICLLPPIGIIYHRLQLHDEVQDIQDDAERDRDKVLLTVELEVAAEVAVEAQDGIDPARIFDQ